MHLEELLIMGNALGWLWAVQVISSTLVFEREPGLVIKQIPFYLLSL